MTDQTIPNVTDDDRKLAREWAEHVESSRAAWGDRFRAAARVILNDIPAPPLPTLADMTYQERAACQRMQCDVIGFRGKYILVSPSDWDGDAVLLGREGEVHYEDRAMVVPRPDLPRLEWPGTGQDGEEVAKVDYVSVAGGRTAYGPWTVARLRKKADLAPALPEGWRLADHENHGRVIVTNPTPDDDGHVYFVAPAPEPLGNDWHPCDPGELTYLDQEAEDVTPAPKAGDVIESADDPRLDSLPVGSVLADSEAVPPNTLAVGSEWVGVDALTRACEESGRDQIVVSDLGGYVSVWSHDAEWWEGSTPPRTTPYTIIHTGKEADW